MNGLPTDITVQSSHLNDILWRDLPTYEARLINDTQVNPSAYEFDIYLKRTNTLSFLCCGLGISLLFDDAINGGGEFSSVYVPGSSEMNTSMIPGNPEVSNLFGSIRVWYLTIPVGPAYYTLISPSGDGTRLGRFRIQTSAPSFAQISPNLKWNFNSTFLWQPNVHI